MRRRERSRRGAEAGATKPTVSVVRPQAILHLAIGLVTLGLTIAHAPASPRLGSAGGALYFAFFASAIAGIVTAIAYRVLPPRLARIERSAALPEDLAGQRRD